jgi:hypothetical protein
MTFSIESDSTMNFDHSRGEDLKSNQEDNSLLGCGTAGLVRTLPLKTIRNASRGEGKHPSSPASLGLTDCFQVDVMGAWNEFINLAVCKRARVDQIIEPIESK